MSIVQCLEDKEEMNRKIIKEAILNGDSQVRAFYEDAVIFITGGSGFLGKQLIEKLTRTCNIKKIYILIRPRKGKSPRERLKAILEDPVYETINKEKPHFADKIVPIEGDTSHIKLGIDDQTWARLADEVNIIINSAATINFNEAIKTATLTNVRGVREILSLARECKHLKSVVHVSTAYSHATKSRRRAEVKEDFYPPPLPPTTLIDLAENVDEEKLAAMIDPLMKENWPNTYTFVKAVAEELVRNETDLPICIVRPAIVISAYREPSVGWVDAKNAYGPSGLVLGVSLGVTHSLLATQDIALDLVPVDVVNNAIIAAAWAVNKRHTANEKQTKIYTVTGCRNPITWREMSKVLNNEVRSIITSQTIWYCFAVETKFKFLYLLLTWILHYIPGIIIDGLCLLVGKKARFFKIYKLVYDVSSVFVFFTNNCWTFHDSNTLQLYQDLSETDKTIFNFDMTSVNIKEMVLIWGYGVQKFIIKEDPKNNDYARKKQFFFKIANYILLPTYLYLLFKTVFTAVTLTSSILLRLFSYVVIVFHFITFDNTRNFVFIE